jgi:hypothetical protein
MKITVFHIQNKWFLPVSDGVREISDAIVNTWRNEGVDINVREVEMYD